MVSTSRGVPGLGWETESIFFNILFRLLQTSQRGKHFPQTSSPVLFLPASLKENLFEKTSKTVSLEIDSSLQTNVPPEPLLGETRGLRLQGAGDTSTATFEVFLIKESDQVQDT